MKLRRHKVSKSSIEVVNSLHKEKLNFWRRLLAQIDSDPQHKERIAMSQCGMCFYEKSRIGAATCTEVQCAFCDVILHSGNTNIDILCLECAANAGLCRHCGCDLDFKNRRQRLIPDPTQSIDA